MQEGREHAQMLTKAAEKMPVWRGVTYRGARYNPNEVANTFGVGKPIPFGAFASSSKDRHVAEKFATGKGGDSAPAADRTASVVFVLTLGNGRDLEKLSAAAIREREVLILPGASFTISSLTELDTGDDGTPPATNWYVVSANQTDSAAQKASPKGEAKTAAGTALPEDMLGQEALAAASKMLHLASQEEGKITGALKDVAAANKGKLVGLENRFKTETSLVRKLGDRVRTRAVATTDVGKEVAAEVSKTFDALRYTIIAPAKDGKKFASQVLPAAIMASVKAQLANYWDAWGDAKSVGYKGINLGFKLPLNPYPPVTPPPLVNFEVQVHTADSYKAKSGTHEMYEEARAAGTTPARRKELEDLMAKRYAKVAVPT
jgi:hypothetical protein